jgi:peptidoglycan/xylan/chitin deacetylase (PgdA/CDA1 family)
VTLSTGVFVVSLDFELIWGTVDLFGPEAFRRDCEVEREVVIDRLLEIFREFEVPATWCVVGHLFLGACTMQDGRKHPEIVPPSHAWRRGDWFADDPCEADEGASIFLGKSLVEKIRGCPIPQEIGSHSFSHAVFGDPGCSRATATSELTECVRLARDMGLELQSFAFPRNSVGHLDVLREHGFTSYRGPEPTWYHVRALPGPIQRLAHLWDVLTAATPPVTLPEETTSGLYNLPGSMIYFPTHGFRRHIPRALRVKRAVKGLRAAAREKRVFHLWLHPTNVASRTDETLAGLRQVFEEARRLRDDDALAFSSMSGLVELVR